MQILKSGERAQEIEGNITNIVKGPLTDSHQKMRTNQGVKENIPNIYYSHPSNLIKTNKFYYEAFWTQNKYKL